MRLVLDDSQVSADGREYLRALNPVSGLPNTPEYRHELLMSEDRDYRAAWAHDNSQAYRDEAVIDPSMMVAVLRGRDLHTYREANADIVTRSLLRNGFRGLLTGESNPEPILGKYIELGFASETAYPSDTLYPV